MEQIKRFIADFGLTRIIIALFLLVLFMMAPRYNVSVPGALMDVFTRFGMNGILVLALVPMIQAGCGLNFGLPLGIIAGLLGATLSIELTPYITSVISNMGIDPFIITPEGKKTIITAISALGLEPPLLPDGKEAIISVINALGLDPLTIIPKGKEALNYETCTHNRRGGFYRVSFG